MSLRTSVIRGACSLGGARIAVSMLNGAGILVLARLLTPDDFGIVAIVTVVLNLIMAMTEASFQAALVHCEDPTPDHVDTVWTMSLIRAGLIFGILVVAAWPLALAYGDARLVKALFVAAVTGAFMDFFNPLLTVATREMKFRPLVLFQISQKFAGLVVAIGLAFWFRDFWAILIGNAVGAVLASFGSYLLISYRPRLCLSRAREIWKFSGWMFLNQVCETLNWRFDQLLIGLNVTKTQLGIYSIADNLAVIPTRELKTPLRNALFPGLANLSADRGRMRSSYLRAQSMVAMITAPAAIGLALVADPAVRVLLGEKWLESIPFVRIIAITYGFDLVITVVRPMAMAMGETKELFLRQVIALAIRIPLIVAGLIVGGLVGAAIGRAISAVFNCLISFMVAKRLLGLPIWLQVKSHGQTAIGLLAMIIVVLSADFELSRHLLLDPVFKLATLSLLGSIAYIFTIFVTWMACGRQGGPVTELISIIEPRRGN